MKTRRGPWLVGLIFALIGAVWMIGQVIGGFLTWVEDLINPDLTTPAAISAPLSLGPPAITNGVGNDNYRIERLY